MQSLCKDVECAQAGSLSVASAIVACSKSVHMLCRYTDASGEATEVYPFNPNGSPDGIAALTAANGRHLAIMPHPERCFMTWQNPWCAINASCFVIAPV